MRNSSTFGFLLQASSHAKSLRDGLDAFQPLRYFTDFTVNAKF